MPVWVELSQEVGSKVAEKLDVEPEDACLSGL
jgi:hypothetical protein